MQGGVGGVATAHGHKEAEHDARSLSRTMTRATLPHVVSMT
jgi:hypothetical protein